MKRKLLFLGISLFFLGACEKEESIDPITVTSIVKNVSISGQSDGAITLSLSGGKEPFSYSWSNGSTSKDLTNITVGTYSVIVTGANGDTASHTAIVAEPAALNLQFTKKNTNALGASNGEINLTITGGVQPYTILCNSIVVGESISDLPAGAYTIQVTDANQAQMAIEVIIADPLALSLVPINAGSFGGEDGSINLNITGGVEPYAVIWNNGDTQEDINAISAGYYTVTVTDAEDISKQKSVSVYEPYDKPTDVANLLSGITRLSQAGLRIEYNSKVLYIDPINAAGFSADADIVLVTHSHGDHFSTGTITSLSNSGTVFAGPSDCQSGLNAINGSANCTLVAPGDSINLEGLAINVVHAYNVVKNFHSSPSSVGYIITINGIRVYHSGDTERIPEMTSYAADIAFLPMGQTYTMVSVASAADAARDTGAELVVPMHYGNAEGTEQDAWNFKSLLEGEIDVVIIPSK